MSKGQYHCVTNKGVVGIDIMARGLIVYEVSIHVGSTVARHIHHCDSSVDL
jgi:hypothetical protein